MSTRYKQCNTCGQRKDYSQFGLTAKNRSGRQDHCHDCVIHLLKEKGTLERYITGEKVFHDRTQKGAFQDRLYYAYKAGVKNKKVNSDRKFYYAIKKASRINNFKEMFPEGN